ncbi:MAG: hypothetical protein Q9177_006184, partial [Variospora cf. flavescens]
PTPQEINRLAHAATDPWPASYILADIISRRAQVGWTTHGHSAVDVNIYASDPDQASPLRGNRENTDVGRYLAEYLDLGDLVEEVTRDLLVGGGKEKGKGWMGRRLEDEVVGKVRDHYEGDFKVRRREEGSMGDWIYCDIVDQLATGFGALLEQVQELDRRNARLEQLLDRMHEQAQLDGVIPSSAPPQSLGCLNPPQDTIPDNEKTGLHIECKSNQLHLRSVAGHIKWHITDGYKAWSSLRCDGIGKYPPSDPFSAWPQQRRTDSLHPPHPTLAGDKPARCPFTAQHVAKLAARDLKVANSSKNGSIPDNELEDPIAAEGRQAEAGSGDALSQNPSAASASKCPIRFLDQHSPEEVAEYFQNHRHEIPRSHEICVKRYQRNEDQIRQLDLKYGNLVNMIQGLGQKHQSMLHTRTDEEAQSQGHTSQEKVEAWAHEVEDDGKGQADGVAADFPTSPRDGRFDRPLKEIRVGESPSRPWGISVPHAIAVAPSAASAHEKPRRAVSLQPELPTPSSLPPEHGSMRLPLKSPEPNDHQQRMTFTGPVFIGYSPDQVVELLQRIGLGKEAGQ